MNSYVFSPEMGVKMCLKWTLIIQKHEEMNKNYKYGDGKRGKVC